MAKECDKSPNHNQALRLEWLAKLPPSFLNGFSVFRHYETQPVTYLTQVHEQTHTRAIEVGCSPRTQLYVQ